MVGTYIALFIIAFLLLVRAGSLLVASLTHIARFFGLSEYVVAFVLMSFATSIPELSIGIASAIQDVPGLSFGNVLGANVLNITLVSGVAVLFAGGLHLRSKINRINAGIIFMLSLLPLAFVVDGALSRIEGVIMLVAFSFYLVRLVGDRAYFTRGIKMIPFNRATFVGSFSSLMNFFGGIFLLIISAGIVTYAGSKLALVWGIENGIFGILFLSISTALPELTFGIRAKMLGHADMAIGNVLGSIAFNAAGIVGIVAILNPFMIEASVPLAITMGFFVLAFVLFLSFVYTRNSINRVEAAVLIGAYLLFVITMSIVVWN